MASRRVARLNEQLRREIAEIVRLDLRDPRIGGVTITEVRVTPDLEHARVYVTMLGEPDERTTTLAGLSAAAAYIRGELGRRLRIRHTPELRFEFDQALEQARRIEELLARVRSEAAPGTVAEEAAARGDEGEGDDVA